MEGTSTYPLSLSSYQITSLIGKGSNSRVYSAVYQTPNNSEERIALKKVKLHEPINPEGSLLRLSHQNLVPIYASFKEGTYLYLVMRFEEYGSLARILSDSFSSGLKDPCLLASILSQVLSGLSYLHSKHIVHKGIKASNILVGSTGNIVLDNLSKAEQYDLCTRNPCWIAPERLISDHESTYKEDIWSFGITVLELSKGVPPYFYYPTRKIMTMIIEKEPPLLSRIDPFHRSLIDMVNLCLKKEPSQRPTADELLSLEFFNMDKRKDYVKAFLQKEVNRIGGAGLLESSNDSNASDIRPSHSNSSDFNIVELIKPCRAMGEDPEDLIENYEDVSENEGNYQYSIHFR